MVRIKLIVFALLLPAIIKLQVVAAQSPLVFKHLTVENGLSSGSVLSLAQDQKGFIWVGTMDGLNRYDGKKVKIFKSFYRNNPIGSSIKITQLLADKQQNLWIGTNNGLYVYNTQLDSFRVFYNSSSEKKSLCDNSIKALSLDNEGNIWVGTQNGLNEISHRNGFVFHCIQIPFTENNLSFNDVQAIHEISNGRIAAGTTNGLIILSKTGSGEEWNVSGTLLKGNSISSIVEDKNQTIWVGTFGTGLFSISRNSKEIKQYDHGINNELTSNIIRKLIIDRKGKIWIGTLKGLSLFDPASEHFESYSHDPNEEYTLNFNSIWDILEDRQGSVWIGTFFGGLNIVEAVSTPFKSYQNEESETGISSNVIGPIIDDERNNLWIGTEAEGLNYFDRTSKIFNRYKSDETKPNSLSSNLVKALARDNKNNIWVGMHNGGVNIINTSGQIIKRFNSKEKINVLNSDDVISLLLDNDNRIWIGTEENGVDIYDINADKLEKFETVYRGKKLVSNAITCFFKDSKNTIWVGTRQGISKLQADENKLTNFLKSNVHGQLQSDYINCFAEEKNGRIWIGTYSGLSFYDPQLNTFGTYTTANGLSGNKVVGIIVDNQNNLWISTNNGLCYLDSARKQFHSFTTDDGLPGNVFNYNSYFKDRNGHLFFGGYKGLVEFNPADMETNAIPPAIILTGLNINAHAINPRDNSGILNKNISEAQKIRLEYDQNILSVDYAVMNFIKPGKNRSAYKLQGYNTEWQYTDEHSANFTNLTPGDYELLIKGCNNDGVWSPASQVLKITILPPPWKTWWAYSLYALAFALLLFGIIYFFASRAALRRKLRYEHMVNVKQQELNKMKMDFFTHISHEIRTPLTLIMGPVEMLMNTIPVKSTSHKFLLTIKANAERLLKLTTDLLEFRKADSGYTQLKVIAANIVDFSYSIFEKFTDSAAKKSINYNFDSKDQFIEVYFDPHYLEIVFTNLLSNAIKFTPEGGVVSMKLTKLNKEFAEIRVCDNGIGIPKESQDKIFSNFYQADAGGIKHLGSGIGLAFSKSLVELHHGILDFRSESNVDSLNHGTCFIVTLRLGKNHFSETHFIKGKQLT